MDYKHSYKIPTPAPLPLVVFNVGFQKCAPNHSWGPGVRDHYLLHYVVSGHGQLETGGKSFQISPGMAFLIAPDQELFYFSSKNDPWEYYWVGFSGSLASILVQQTGLAQQVAMSMSCGQQLRQSLLDIYKVRGTTYAHSLRMAAYLQLTLALLMEHCPKTTDSTDYATRGGNYMQQNYGAPITVEDVANFVGICRSHLCRAFQESYHKSPKQYLAHLRMQRACHLLKTTHLPIHMIATSVGFTDQLYFSRAFRKTYGVSPANYRKE